VYSVPNDVVGQYPKNISYISCDNENGVQCNVDKFVPCSPINNKNVILSPNFTLLTDDNLIIENDSNTLICTDDTDNKYWDLFSLEKMELLINSFLPILGGNHKISKEMILKIYNDAMSVASLMYGIREAIIWGDGFTIDKTIVYRDECDFKHCNFHLSALCKMRHSQNAKHRLSLKRIKKCLGLNGEKCVLSDFNDLARIKDIAVNGMKIPLPDNFKCYDKVPPFRKKYVETASACHKMIMDQYKAGTMILLPTDLVLEKLEGCIHFSCIHWAKKKGKFCGRLICDLANAHLRYLIPLNGSGKYGKQHIRDEVTKLYGVINHPLIDELVLMIIEVADEHGWDNISLFKLDLHGAFNLLIFANDVVKYLAFPLLCGLTAIFIVGLFGWTGTPYAFQVITRVLSDLCKHGLWGKCKWYVDDAMGVTLTSHVFDDINIVKNYAIDLLGPTAIADDKTEHGRVLVWLGWKVDLDNKLISLSHYNMMKTLYIFLKIDINEKVVLNLVESAASLASRYAMVCRHMKPYTSALYDDISAFHLGKHVKMELSEHGKIEVLMWRAFLCLLKFDESTYARSLDSFRDRKATILFEYDSSLSSFAVGISKYDAVSNKYDLLAYTSVISPFALTDDSSKQNTYEYLAVMVGLLLAKHLKIPKGFSYDLVGDSISSLYWCKHDRVNSKLARRAGIGFTLLSVILDATVSEIKHLPGVLNVIYDGLSRGKSGCSLGLDPLLFVPTNLNCSHTLCYLKLCDPDLPLESIDEHISLSSDLLNILHDESFDF
jgi:hypothetical protein